MVRRLRCGKGFSLLELAIVMSIVSTLAALALPMFIQRHRTEAVDRFATELNWALEGIRRYYLQNGQFPPNWAALIGARAIPSIPQDPFGGQVLLVVNNAASPRSCRITIRNGVAGTEYGGQIRQRVPFVTHNLAARTINIDMTEFMINITQDIVYGGVHSDGDLIPVYPCLGGYQNYPFTFPAAHQNQDGTPIMAYRTWVDTVPGGPTGNQYRVHCRTRGDVSGVDDGFGGNCLVTLFQICH